MATFTAGDKFANCFVCSPTNPRGLHLKITTVDGKAHTEIVPEDYMCGLNGLMHGGFSLMLMDEVMYYADTVWTVLRFIQNATSKTPQLSVTS